MINKYLNKIEKEKAFSKTTQKIKEYKNKHPEAELISLGIGDVSKPVVKPIIEAMHKAVDDLSSMERFQGYGLYYGLESLKKAIVENEYPGLDINTEEIFVGDGTKSDSGNILELFDKEAKILMCNPIYPIYMNSAYAMGRDIYLIDVDDNYKMPIPKEHYDIIYICSPSNPIGNAYNYDDLKKLIDYANKEEAVILYDNVYDAFVESKDVPKTIYEVEGSKTCAIEMRSFSKTASFTGLRCSYLVLPKELKGNLIPLWKERCINRFNGASYISQVGAEASYSKEAKELINKNILTYKENARYLKENFEKLGFEVVGGKDAPYMWISTPNNLDSFDAFDFFLEELNIITIPGEVFGDKGRKHMRISALGTLENSIKAIERIKKYYEKKI